MHKPGLTFLKTRASDSYRHRHGTRQEDFRSTWGSAVGRWFSGQRTVRPGLNALRRMGTFFTVLGSCGHASGGVKMLPNSLDRKETVAFSRGKIKPLCYLSPNTRTILGSWVLLMSFQSCRKKHNKSWIRDLCSLVIHVSKWLANTAQGAYYKIEPRQYVRGIYCTGELSLLYWVKHSGHLICFL